MKRFTIFAALLFCCFAVLLITFMMSSLPVLADDDYVPCPISPYGYHQMIGRASGLIYIDGQLVVFGYASQCIHCNEVIISEGNPHWNGGLVTSAITQNGIQDVKLELTRLHIFNQAIIYYNSNFYNSDFRGYEWI